MNDAQKVGRFRWREVPDVGPKEKPQARAFRLRKSGEPIVKLCLANRNLHVERLPQTRAGAFERGRGNINQMNTLVRAMLQEQRELFTIPRPEFNELERHACRADDLATVRSQ